MKRRMLPILLSLALCLSLLPTGALAAGEDVTYIEYSWNGSTNTLSRNASTNTLSSVTRTKSAGEYTVIDNMKTPTYWNGSYVARGEVTINGRVTVNGSAQLILEDGCKLTVTQGIQVGGNCHLTIYGQSEGTGTLVANGVLGDPGIGASYTHLATITIHGGNVTANGSTAGAKVGAGIGIGIEHQDPTPGTPLLQGGTFTIYGGTVTATGGSYGAGIGGGIQEDSGTVYIYGGTVTATGTENAAGIGGGGASGIGGASGDGKTGGDGGKVNIYGGRVTATGGTGRNAGAGIDGSTVTISGGTVTANGSPGISGGFSTGDNGHAVIFSNTAISGVGVQPTPPSQNWTRGVIFQGNTGKVYSSPVDNSSVTPIEDFTIGEGMTLTIGDTQPWINGSLTIGPDVTLTNKGTIAINNSRWLSGNGITNNGKIINYGTITNSQKMENQGAIDNYGAIANSGTITNTNTGTLTNDGTIANSGTITNNGTIDMTGNGTLTGNDVTGTPVNHKVTDVSLDKTSLTLEVGGSETLTATVQPDNATNQNVTWSSSDPNVATVENGVVAAVGAGTATITVKTQDGDFTATCEVTVERPYTPPPANPNYRIDVTSTEGGAVTADPAAAKAGTEVTLTVTPEEGYEVGTVTVTDRFGDAVEVTEQADGTYTFTMPSGQVKVAVTFVEAQPEPLPFTDVTEGDWFHDAVQYAYDNGLMDGVGEGQFAPNATTNRAMVVTILYRLAGEPTVSGQSDFTDVADGLWYSNAVLWAAEKGIVNGISETEFAPAGDLTREQLATVLYRYAESMGYDVSAQADLSGFPDAGDIQDYAAQALSWAVAEGLLQGFEDDTLQPQSTATRAQIATILMRFCETVAK